MLRTDLVRPVSELLAGHAAERGGAMAFRDDRVVRTWAQVYERTGRLAGHLAALGAAGGCVAIVLENRVELAESYLAVVRAGAVAREPAAFDAGEVGAFVAAHLAQWKVPVRFELIEAVPRTGSGKTQRRRLFELTSR